MEKCGELEAAVCLRSSSLPHLDGEFVRNSFWGQQKRVFLHFDAAEFPPVFARRSLTLNGNGVIAACLEREGDKLVLTWGGTFLHAAGACP